MLGCILLLSKNRYTIGSPPLSIDGINGGINDVETMMEGMAVLTITQHGIIGADGSAMNNNGGLVLVSGTGEISV